MLDDFIQSVRRQEWSYCSENCFRILYKLPVDLQIKLPIYMMRRYLPIFKSKWLDFEWSQQILDDVEQWVKKFGRRVPEGFETANPADAAFLFCFDALLLAVYCKTNKLTLTSSCACAVDSAINARRTNVWIADDPEAVELWSNQGYFPGRSVTENAASIAISEREWSEVIEWLKKEQIWTYADETEAEEVETALADWKNHEKLLIVPDLLADN